MVFFTKSKLSNQVPKEIVEGYVRHAPGRKLLSHNTMKETIGILLQDFFSVY